MRCRAKEKYEYKKLIKLYKLESWFDCCCICGWKEATIDMAHIEPHALGGQAHKYNIVPLCPNHHRVYDRGLLNDIHTDSICSFISRIYERIG